MYRNNSFGKNRYVINLGGIVLKRIFALLLTVLLICITTVAPVYAKENVSLADDAKSAILIEQDTGQILFAKNENQSLAPASMTKIMTLLLIFEKLYDGTLKLDEKVAASEYAASMGGSQIFLEPGEEMSVDALLRGITIASGNDAAVVMAERIAGSEEEFVKLMNKKAKQLGLKNTLFKNCTGLPADGHVSSAYDMAVISKALLKYEDVTKYSGLYEDYLREDTDKKFWLVNTNKLVKFYSGCDGLKTGYTTDAKYCLTATAKRNDMRVIGVVMGAETSKIRNAQMMQMFDYAFGKYEVKTILDANQVMKKEKVEKGSEKDVPIINAKPLRLLQQKGVKHDKITETLEIDKKLKAPLKKGQKVGTLTLKENGKVIAHVDLITEKAVKKASFFDLFKRSTTKLFGL